jgi:hypothetical protein
MVPIAPGLACGTAGNAAALTEISMSGPPNKVLSIKQAFTALKTPFSFRSSKPGASTSIRNEASLAGWRAFDAETRTFRFSTDSIRVFRY